MERFDLPPLPDGRAARSAVVLGWTDDVAHQHVEIALAHPIKLIANALGSPPKDVIDQAHEHGVKVAALAGKPCTRRAHVNNGVDIIVAQGYEAGGHTGEIVDDGARARGRRRGRAGCRCSPPAASAAVARSRPRSRSARRACGSARSGSRRPRATRARRCSETLPRRDVGRHGPLAPLHRQAGAHAAQRVDRRVGRTGMARARSMPLQNILTSEANARIARVRTQGPRVAPGRPDRRPHERGAPGPRRHVRPGRGVHRDGREAREARRGVMRDLDIRYAETAGGLRDRVRHRRQRAHRRESSFPASSRTPRTFVSDVPWYTPILQTPPAGGAHMITFDKRGHRPSRIESERSLPTLEERMDDVRAVMDAAGLASEPRWLGAVSEGGPMCDACSRPPIPSGWRALVALGHLRSRDVVAGAAAYEGVDPVAGEPVLRHGRGGEHLWGQRPRAAVDIGSHDVPTDEATRRQLAKFLGSSATPTTRRWRAPRTVSACAWTLDRPLKAPSRRPRWWLHRSGGSAHRAWPTPDLDLARAHPRTPSFSCPGDFHFSALGGGQGRGATRRGDRGVPHRRAPRLRRRSVAGDRAVHRYRRLDGAAAALGDRRWHDVLDAHDRRVRRELERPRAEIKTTGDGFLASFDGPAARPLRAGDHARAARLDLTSRRRARGRVRGARRRPRRPGRPHRRPRAGARRRRRGAGDQHGARPCRWLGHRVRGPRDPRAAGGRLDGRSRRLFSLSAKER